MTVVDANEFIGQPCNFIYFSSNLVLFDEDVRFYNVMVFFFHCAVQTQSLKSDKNNRDASKYLVNTSEALQSSYIIDKLASTEV